MENRMNDIDKNMVSIKRTIQIVNKKKDLLINQHISPLGITANQFRVLSRTRRLESVSPVDLKNYLSVDAGSMIRMIARLESKKLIERLPNPDNKRSALVKLTAEGIKVCDNAYIFFDEKFQMELMKNLTEDEIETLQNLLEKLI